MKHLRRPGRLAIVFLLLGCAVLAAALLTVRSTTAQSPEPSLGPLVDATRTSGSTPTTGPPSGTPTTSPSGTATDDDDDDDGATPVPPGSPSTAGDDDDDDDDDGGHGRGRGRGGDDDGDDG